MYIQIFNVKRLFGSFRENLFGIKTYLPANFN